MGTKRKKQSSLTGSTDTRCRLGERPKTDKGFFEEMTKAVFRSGMKWDVIDKKWPDFKKAFTNFSIQKVSRFGDPELERLMNDEGIIRNHKKIIAPSKTRVDFKIFAKNMDRLPSI